MWKENVLKPLTVKLLPAPCSSCFIALAYSGMGWTLFCRKFILDFLRNSSSILTNLRVLIGTIIEKGCLHPS